MSTPSLVSSSDIRTISLIGLAHGTSHFFHLLLPPLFPFFMQDFGLSFSKLGLLTTVFFVVSGIGQALSGFLVDRYGATRLLYFGLSAFAVAALLVSRAQGYVGLIAGAAALGMGNAVFHPVDYTILNRRVSTPRLGHAYSTHGITGNLGWALAPVFLVGIASASSWRVAGLCAAALAIAVLALMLWRREALEVAPTWNAKASKHEVPAEHALAFMKLPVVWLCFGFFFTSAMALGAIQNFSVPALKQLYALPLEQATFALSAYLVCGALGMAVGGFVATKTKHSHLVIALGMGIGVLLLGLLGLQLITSATAPLLMIVSGFSIGIAGPSRDLLIKKATPVGSTGRVYGTVYSGLDVGLAMSPLLLGVALDAGKPQAVFLLAAAALLGAIGFAMAVSQRRAASSATPSTALSKLTKAL
jgi:MFS transporter, FSR family, fosmidomycin resistance protein